MQSTKRTDHLAPSTIRHRVGAFARCFDWTVKTGTPMLADNPLRKLPKRYATYTEEDQAAVEMQGLTAKEDSYRDRRPSAEEEATIRSLMAGAKPEGRERAFELRYRPALVFLFELAIESGMRMREMYTLGPEQFDPKQRTVFLDKSKNGNKRPVPLTSVALTAYERYLEAVQGAHAEMEGYSFAAGYLFPWISEMQGAMSTEGKPLLRRKLLERVTSRL